MSRSVDARAPEHHHHSSVDGPAAWLRDLLTTRGGFTFHHGTGDQVADGLAVCADPAVTFGFPIEHWTDDHVNRWVHRCAERPPTIDLDADLHLGGWLDRSGWVWLDVVRVFPSHRHDDAVAFGRRRRQRAIFDLGRHELVPLALEGAR